MSTKKKKPATEQVIACTPRELPPEMWEAAAKVAVEENPVNQPAIDRARACGLSLTVGHIAALTQKYWRAHSVDLSVSFLDSPPQALKERIVSHLNSWGPPRGGNVRFRLTSGQGQVRIAREQGGGYWSYLGTDILLIPANQPTMNLDSFTMSTSESEFLRVVRHEGGHTLGYPHEHMRREVVNGIDAQKAIAYFRRTQGWDANMVRAQVLTPLEEESILGTDRADLHSIMAYQLPAEIMRNGQPVPGGTDIDDDDYAFCQRIYPPLVSPPPPPPPTGGGTKRITLEVDGSVSAVRLVGVA